MGSLGHILWKTAVLDAATLMRGDGREDCIIKCQEREWKVHKQVLSMHSKVLRDLCDKPFLGRSGNYEITIQADEPACIDIMLNYLYTASYSGTEGIGLARDMDHDLSMHCSIYILAEKYDIAHLQELALRTFEGLLSDPSLAPHFLKVVPRAYQAYYLTAPRRGAPRPGAEKIRQTIVDAAIRAEVLAAEDESTVRFLRKYPRFGLDVARALHSRLREQEIPHRTKRAREPSVGDDTRAEKKSKNSQTGEWLDVDDEVGSDVSD